MRGTPRPELVETALSGEGSTRSPGEWNPRGLGVAYASKSLELAALEILACAEELEVLSHDVALRLGVPEASLTVLSLVELMPA